MPERAIIPLLPALSLGFILGVLVAVTQLTSSGRTIVGIVGVVLVVGAGLSSVVKAPGRPADKRLLALLRAGLAAAVFLFLYIALVAFLGEGAVIVGLLFLLGTVVLALILAQLKVAPAARERRPDGQTAPSP